MNYCTFLLEGIGGNSNLCQKGRNSRKSIYLLIIPKNHFLFLFFISGFIQGNGFQVWWRGGLDRPVKERGGVYYCMEQGREWVFRRDLLMSGGASPGGCDRTDSLRLVGWSTTYIRDWNCLHPFSFRYLYLLIMIILRNKLKSLALKA